MTTFRDWNDYLYPGTDVLRNKPGVRDAAHLRNAEELTARTRMAEILHVHPIPGDLDRAHLQAIHRHVFGDIYEWAGECRVGPRFPQMMTKSGPSPESITAGKYDAQDGYGYHYFSAGEEMVRHFDRYIAAMHSSSDPAAMDSAQFAAVLAETWGEINAAHIFREGNTRTQVVFFTYVARHYGHALDYGRFSTDPMFRAKFNAARFLCIAKTNTSLLVDTLTELVDVPAETTDRPHKTGDEVVDDYQPHYISSGEPPTTSRRKLLRRVTQSRKTAAAPAPPSTALPSRMPPLYRVGVCGAPTKKGTPCRRRGRCPHHR